MSDNTNTAESGAGAAAPADTTQPVANAPEQQVELTPEQQEAEQAEQQRQEEEGRKKNRTRDYIERLQRRVAELEARPAPPQTAPSRQPLAPETGPKLEDFGYDINAFQQARDTWVLEQAQTRFHQEAQQRAEQERDQRTWTDYSTRAAEYANEHDDFYAVVGSLPPLPMPLQAAIAAHPNGPAIAYHLGNNLSDLITYASTPPQFADFALQQVAARLGSAPAATQQTAAPAAPAKPLSKAPPPVPTVGGRAPASPDPERMTTDQWREWREAQLKAKRG
jgi:hypothetical protein